MSTPTNKGFPMEGCVALVTGANRPNGIGNAIVEALLAAGAAKVYATGRNVKQLDGLVAKHGGKVIAVQLDLTDLERVSQLYHECPDVNLVVNNAGYIRTNNGPLDSIAAAQQEMAVNYIGPLALTQAFQDNLRDTIRPSAVVNVLSICSFVNFPVAGTYSCTKAAGHSMTIALRRDLPNALVMGVYPGPIDTDIGDWNKGNPMPPPSVVADAIVDGLRNGCEDVFPDQAAIDLHDEYLHGPKEQEMRLHGSNVGKENRRTSNKVA